MVRHPVGCRPARRCESREPREYASESGRPCARSGAYAMNDETLVGIAKALADPTRYRMLQQIRANGEMTCTDVHECFKLAQPTISHHLNTLRKAGLIKVRKEGVFHYLSAVPSVLREFSRAVGSSPERASRTPARRAAKKTTRSAKPVRS